MENLTSLMGGARPSFTLAILATFIVAGTVKGVSGLGLPTVAVALLGLIMPPAEAAALLIVPSLVTNLWQLFCGPSLKLLLYRLWPMLAGICMGTWGGGWLMTGRDLSLTASALGWALMAYAAIGLAALKLHVAPARERWLAPMVGAVTGCVTSVTGVFVIPAVPYLQGMNLNKDELVQSMGLAFTCSTLALALNLLCAGQLHSSAAGMSFFAVLPALAGMALGQWVRGRVSLVTFRRIFFGALFLLGAHLAAKPFL